MKARLALGIIIGNVNKRQKGYNTKFQESA